MIETRPNYYQLLTSMVVAIVFAFSNTPVNAQTWPADFQRYILNIMQSDGIPGVALALVKGNEIIVAEGFGLRDLSANLPVNRQTLFHIGSTHKSMTAMMVATLVDKGALDWDTPIVDYAPSFSLSNSDARAAITMRHLLSMRGGISDDAEGDLPDQATPEDVFDVIENAPLLGMPGKQFSYSNLSSAAAGYLGVLALGGNENELYEGYARLLQNTILDPIGMRTATIKRAQALAYSNYAQSYVLSDHGVAKLSPSYDFEGDALAPSGSLKANVYEMALYVATHMNGGVAPNGNQVLSQQNSEALFLPYLEDYAMGWEVAEHEGIKIIMHAGAFDDYASVIGFFPEFRVGFVILLNSEMAGDYLIEDAPFELADLLSEQL